MVAEAVVGTIAVLEPVDRGRQQIMVGAGGMHSYGAEHGAGMGMHV